MKKGVVQLVPLIIGIVVAVLIGIALFPTMWNNADLGSSCATVNATTGHCGIGSTWNNQTAYSSTVTTMMGLAPLFVALGIGAVGIALVVRNTGIGK